MCLWKWKWYWTLVGFDYSFFTDMHRLKFNFSYRNMLFTISFQSKRWFPKDILLIQHLLVGLDTQTVSFVSCVKNILKLVGQGLFKCVTSEVHHAYKGPVLMVALFVLLVSGKLAKQSVSNNYVSLAMCWTYRNML